jgi:uncharacterized protein YbcV (DUF1398 family)
MCDIKDSNYFLISLFVESKKRDNMKIAYCADNNISLVTINYNEMVDSPDKLLEKIHASLEA